MDYLLGAVIFLSFYNNDPLLGLLFTVIAVARIYFMLTAHRR